MPISTQNSPAGSLPGSQMKPALARLRHLFLRSLAGSAALLSAHAEIPPPPAPSWTGAANDGLWTSPANWSGGIPNAVGAQATFSTPAVPTTVALNGGKTVGLIVFNNPSTYTIGSSADTLTLDNGASPAGISVQSGMHHIAANLTLSSNLSVSAAAGSKIILDGEIFGSKSLISSGSVALTSPTHYTGPTQITTGTLALSGDATFGGSASIRVESPATLDVNDVDTLFSVQASQNLVNLGVVSGNLEVFGTLSGSGLQDGTVYLAAGGHLAPGDGVGTLTFGAGLELTNGGITDFELGNSSDLLRIAGGTFLGCGLAGVTVNFNQGLAFTPGQYVLIDWTGATADGVQATDFKAGQLASTLQAEFVVVGETLRVNIQNVPEPGSLLLAGFGVLSLLGARRFRNSSAFAGSGS